MLIPFVGRKYTLVKTTMGGAEESRREKAAFGNWVRDALVLRIYYDIAQTDGSIPVKAGWLNRKFWGANNRRN